MEVSGLIVVGRPHDASVELYPQRVAGIGVVGSRRPVGGGHLIELYIEWMAGREGRLGIIIVNQAGQLLYSGETPPFTIANLP